MKTTKILTLALLASSVVASAAYAGGEQIQKRIAEENAAYFAKQGNTHSNSAPSAKSPDYQFNNKPEQRMAANNAAYFQGRQGSGSGAAAAARQDYQFETTPAQRTAKRNYDYFSNQK